jgi:hypothetical protein
MRRLSPTRLEWSLPWNPEPGGFRGWRMACGGSGVKRLPGRVRRVPAAYRRRVRDGTASTTPATSWPGTNGRAIPGKPPPRNPTSHGPTPAPCTRISACPAAGAGSGCSPSSTLPIPSHLPHHRYSHGSALRTDHFLPSDPHANVRQGERVSPRRGELQARKALRTPQEEQPRDVRAPGRLDSASQRQRCSPSQWIGRSNDIRSSAT